MAVRDDFSAGEVLAAADLNDTFASKLPYSYGTATPSTSDNGFLWYDSNSTPPEVKFWDGAAFQALGGGGTILQIVRATDTTLRSTTSTSYVDVTGMSVTITPQKSTSAILIFALFEARISGGSSQNVGLFRIADSSNNAISGAEEFVAAIGASTTIVQLQTPLAYATPATTSATTYKLRFSADGSGETVQVRNNSNTGQMFAIEVSA